MKRGVFPVEVRPVNDPDGQRAVLLQLPDGFMVVSPPNARKIAALLIDAADEAEA